MSVSTTGPAPAPATKSLRTAPVSARHARSASDGSIGPGDERLIQNSVMGAQAAEQPARFDAASFCDCVSDGSTR